MYSESDAEDLAILVEAALVGFEPDHPVVRQFSPDPSILTMRGRSHSTIYRWVAEQAPVWGLVASDSDLERIAHNLYSLWCPRERKSAK